MKLFGRTIKINFIDEELMPQSVGMANILKGKIDVTNNMSDDSTNATILHETIHLISDMLNLELNEKQVFGLENGIYSFLKDNGIEVDFMK